MYPNICMLFVQTWEDPTGINKSIVGYCGLYQLTESLRSTLAADGVVWMRETLLYGYQLKIYLIVSVINSVMNLVTAVLTSMHCKSMFE